MTKTAWLIPSAALLFALGAGACGNGTSAAGPEPADDPAVKACVAATSVAPYKELVVVDEDVLADPRAKNATSGVWSFRHAIENMMPANAEPSEFVRSWLMHWIELKSFNGWALERPNESRDTLMNGLVICPWLKRTPANACDDACNVCTARTLDLALAPFRLIAIANRMDLRDEVEFEPAGEGRLVFALSKGVGDEPVVDPAVENLPMSLIFEYRLPDSRSLVEWAQAWHGLSELSTTDEPYRAALEAVTNAFTKRGANPSGMNGSALAQVRTNESTLNWIWQLREFALDASGQLRLRALRNTPPMQLNDSTRLRDFVVANRDAILANRFEVPLALRGGSADIFGSSWRLPDVDEPTRKAFGKNTCNGCHLRETESLDTSFHVSVYKRGTAKLSKFTVDELSVRATKAQRALCERR